MKILLLLAVALLAFTGAQAADLGPRTVYKAPEVQPASWTGFYVGANLGYGWSNENATITGGNALSNTVLSTGIVPATFNTDPHGWLGGLTVGYNWNYGWGVLGVEGDISFADIKGNDASRFAIGAFSVTTATETKTDWLATLRARAGIFVGNGLLYVTGGGAFADVKTTVSSVLATPIPAFNATAAGSKSDTKVGWTIGGGYETPLWAGWTLKGEYLYVDLGKDDVPFATTVAGAPIVFSEHVTYKQHITRLGVNYRF